MFARAWVFYAVFVSMLLFSGSAEAQVAVCTNQASSNVVGGVRAAKNCNGSLVSGYATFGGAAEVNAQGFANLGVSTGRYCSFQPNDVKTVGQFTYMVDFTCTGGGQVTGYGNDATQTG
ncbi:MAG: hypothetical protein Q4G62_07285 [Pseudomonadota bacterium]|nr:hypothetical protein [Pseudomonadota bacterium]